MTTPARNAGTLDRALSVNEVIARFPQTISVFNRFGIDSCCGGAAALDEAAHRDGADADALFMALESAVARA